MLELNIKELINHSSFILFIKIIKENAENNNIFERLYTAIIFSDEKNIEENTLKLNNESNNKNIFAFLSINTLFFIEYIIPYAIKNNINKSITYKDIDPYSKKLLFIF